jgi:hypothetical protein
MLGTFPGPVWEYTEWNGRFTRARLAFSGATAITASESGLFVGLPDRSEIHAFDAEAALERIIRRPYDSVRVTQEDIGWLLERRLREVDGVESEQMVRRAYRELNHAELCQRLGCRRGLTVQRAVLRSSPR